MGNQNSLTKVKNKIVDLVISNLENGVIPWENGLTDITVKPFNPISKTVYRGYNSLFLYIVQSTIAKSNNMKYIDPRWLTFVNAKNKGYSIKKNEHGTPIEFFQRISVNSDNKEKEEVDVDVNKTINRMIIKTYTVFNYTQLNGYGDTIPAYEPTEYKWSSNEKLDSMIDKINITMQYGSIYDGGSYSIGKDLISVPNKEMFKTSDDYYATLFHEIIHWTGHKSRLDRNFESLNNKDYAFEELVAELGSLYLKEKIGLKNSSKTINNSSSYIKSWIKLLNNEKNSLFIALKKADEAVEYIMNIIERGNEKCA